MDRAYKSGASTTAPTAPASPSIGYPTSGDPVAGVPKTVPGPYLYHMLVEELRAIVVAGGLTPNHLALDQVLTAILALVDQKSLGRASSWVTLTGSRSLGVTYYNTTTKPIMVSVECQNFTAGNTLYATIDSVSLGGTTTPSSGGIATLCFVVPPGKSYVVSQATAGSPISRWTELR